VRYTHLHSERQGVEQDEDEDDELEPVRGDDQPDLLLTRRRPWNVATKWARRQSELDALALSA